MKKSLLVACCLFPLTANAGGVKYNATGRTDTLYGYSDVSERYEKKDNNNALTNSSELNLSAESELDSGAKVGVYLDTFVGFNKSNEDYNNGTWGKEIYGSVENDNYGKLSLGEMFNAAYQFSEGVPKIGAIGVNNSSIIDFIENPNWQRKKHHTTYKTLNSTAINTDGVAPKVSYSAPEYEGTVLGFSYTPDIEDRRGLIDSRSHYSKKQDGYVASISNEYDLGFADMSTSIGYGLFRRTDNEFSGGMSFFRGGWTLASSYRKTYVDGKKNQIKPDLSDGYREGHAWDIGLSYEIGPYEVGLSYFNSKSDRTDNQDRILLLSNKYQVNKWANVYLAAAHVEFEGENKSVDSNNKGYSFITGVGLEF